jgi:hypothetical protein
MDRNTGVQTENAPKPDTLQITAPNWAEKGLAAQSSFSWSYVEQSSYHSARNVYLRFDPTPISAPDQTIEGERQTQPRTR